MEGKKNKVRILRMIMDDMEQDAKDLDGKPFNGKTVATYFGYQGAAIAKIAEIVVWILDELEE